MRRRRGSNRRPYIRILSGQKQASMTTHPFRPDFKEAIASLYPNFVRNLRGLRPPKAQILSGPQRAL
ncbi:hypothetical protein BC629DRAFT_1547932 [Irpex lacteus]|nr:hypothetical protein BC629DRAFT_1547932 [Irpex lacteus]